MAKINWKLNGHTITLSKRTSAALDGADSDAAAVEREIKQDAETLSLSMRCPIDVETSNGILVRRLSYPR
jgi:hypothetical protein